VLDFDGVVGDSLLECAAVTWYAKRLQTTDDIPPLPRAVTEVPDEFLATFSSVRAYCNTLDDFMVANALAEGSTVNREEFERARGDVGLPELAAEAASAERIRDHWRTNHFAEWIALHTVYREVADLLNAAAGAVAIVSAKDADSIWAVLAHCGLGARVQTVVGSCRDKRRALSELAATAGRIVFIDDNLENAVSASALPEVEAKWATWGYHSPEDVLAAVELGFPSTDLDQLDGLIPNPTLPAVSQ
jgi:FMN phosphatase YigB (HAD superfamily)